LVRSVHSSEIGASTVTGVAGSSPYPGTEASVAQLLALAHEYHAAHNHLMVRPNSGQAHASAPARLLAIQAIELYLNAFLRNVGESPQTIRGLQHDLGKRTALAVEKGLILKKRTADHMMALTATREYLSSRYGPELSSTWSNMNRIAATLKELFEKVDPLVRHALAKSYTGLSIKDAQ